MVQVHRSRPHESAGSSARERDEQRNGWRCRAPVELLVAWAWLRYPWLELQRMARAGTPQRLQHCVEVAQDVGWTRLQYSHDNRGLKADWTHSGAAPAEGFLYRSGASAEAADGSLVRSQATTDVNGIRWRDAGGLGRTEEASAVVNGFPFPWLWSHSRHPYQVHLATGVHGFATDGMASVMFVPAGGALHRCTGMVSRSELQRAVVVGGRRPTSALRQQHRVQTGS